MRGVQPLRAGQGNSFLLRKLHSLTGIVPIGAFLIEHLISNFEALKGPAAYGAQVKFLNGLPFVRVLEWVFIFMPILYHALYGVYITFRGRQNVNVYPWAGNWMYLIAARDRADRLRLHHPARLAAALCRQSAFPSIPARPSTKSRSSSRIPGCSPSTPSP